MARQLSPHVPSERVACAIAGVGLACAAGSDPASLFGASAGNITGIRPDTGFRVSDPLAASEQHVLPCPVSWVAGEAPNERIWELAGSALNDLAAEVPAGCFSGRVHVIMMLPEAHARQRNHLDESALADAIRAVCTTSSKLSIQWAAGDNSRFLVQAIETVQCRDADLVLLGGADSLVDSRTWEENGGSIDLMTQGRGLGLVPGEAACWLALAPLPSDDSNMPVIGQISGIGVSPMGDAPPDVSGGAMAASIQTALKDAGIGSNQIGAVVMTTGTERSCALEWYSAASRVWPVPDSREPFSAPMPAPQVPDESECFRVARAVGWAGAAQILLALAVACQRFSYKDSLPGDVLVCETGPGEVRCAVVLKSVTPGIHLSGVP